MRNLRSLTAADIVLIHHRIVDTIGGLHGIRNPGALESVTAAARQAVFGRELYPTVFEKAAVYAHDIIAFHPFVDGNKRTGITAASVFLADNGLPVRADVGALYELALFIATKKPEIADIASWFRTHVSPKKK